MQQRVVLAMALLTTWGLSTVVGRVCAFQAVSAEVRFGVKNFDAFGRVACFGEFEAVSCTMAGLVAKQTRGRFVWSCRTLCCE